jgi:hypothetical protein
MQARIDECLQYLQEKCPDISLIDESFYSLNWDINTKDYLYAKAHNCKMDDTESIKSAVAKKLELKDTQIISCISVANSSLIESEWVQIVVQISARDFMQYLPITKRPEKKSSIATFFAYLCSGCGEADTAETSKPIIAPRPRTYGSHYS